MIKMSGRLKRSSDPIAVIHMGEVDEFGKQDVSYKKTPRFVIKKYVPDLRFRESPPPHEMQNVAVEKFANGDPLQLTSLPLQFVSGTAEAIFEVGKMCSTGYRKFGCVSRNQEDWADEDDPRLVDLDKIKKYNTEVVPVETRPGMPAEWHHGHVAKRTIGRDTFVVPCPQEPHDCPYLRKLDIDKDTGKPKTWSDGSPKYIYACNITGILHASVQGWYPKGSGGIVALWTRSWDSIRNISGFLNAAEWFWARLGVPLNYVSVLLTVERTLTADPDGKKQPQPLLRMEYDPTFAAITQKILENPRSVLQLSAGSINMSDIIESQPKALHQGIYTMPDGEQRSDVVYTIKSNRQESNNRKPDQKTAQRTSTQQQKQSNGEVISGKALVELKKAADAANRTDEFIAARQDNAALIELRDDLYHNAATDDGDEAGGELTVDEIDGVFADLWAEYEEAFKLPSKEHAIKLILMLDNDVSAKELPADKLEMFAEELGLLRSFVDSGGTLEQAATSTGVDGFLEHGWFGGGFVSHRRQAVDAIINA